MKVHYSPFDKYVKIFIIFVKGKFGIKGKCQKCLGGSGMYVLKQTGASFPPRPPSIDSVLCKI